MPHVLLLVIAAALGWIGAAHGTGSAASQRALLSVGDSLAVGTDEYLPGLFKGWSVQTRADVGLHTDQGVALLRAYGSALPAVVVVSLGTNDDPRFVSGFARDVEEIVDLAGPSRCVVWPTIVRPPAVGTTYDGYNDALRTVAERHPNLQVVDWAALVSRHPGWMDADGVHVGPSGYRARAAALAAAVRGCMSLRFRWQLPG